MILMTKHFEIKNFSITFVLRHKWDNNINNFMSFRGYQLGLFFRRDKAVAKKGFNTHDWVLVPEYIIGLNLLVVKCWITFDWGVMHLKE